MVLAEPIKVTLMVVAVLEELKIPYLVGGSLASSLHGVPRSTADVDMVADMGPAHVDPFVGLLQDEFYVDADMIQEAIAHRSSFNIIHLSSMYKVDIFIFRNDAFSAEALHRAEPRQLGGQLVMVASAEDTVIEKLRWYRLGQEVSDRQWNDVLGVLRRLGERLNRSHMERWARTVGVDDLLIRALKTVGTEPRESSKE